MKKIFYIVLVIVILLVIGRFVKQENSAPVADENTVVEETIVDENAISAAANPDAIGDGEVVEEAEEVVEVNPEETADEDETIVNE